MRTSRDWGKLVRRLELLMRLRSFPVAFKLLEKKETLAEVPFLRRMNHKVTLCQLITIVRTYDWTVGADLDDFISPHVPFHHRAHRPAGSRQGWNIQVHCLDENPGGRPKIRKFNPQNSSRQIPGGGFGPPGL